MAHIDDGDKHVVAAQLRVLITPSADGGYVAQGLEIDYVATGGTIEEAQNRFVEGWVRTVRALIDRGRSLDAMFKSQTPREIWRQYLDSDRRDLLTCATVLDLSDRLPEGAPFHGLAFCRPEHIAVA